MAISSFDFSSYFLPVCFSYLNTIKLFGGIGASSRAGILVKGSNYLEALSQAKAVIFDKTGTLTRGEFFVTQIIPANGVSKKEIVKLAAIAESSSPHPIDRKSVV